MQNIQEDPDLALVYANPNPLLGQILSIAHNVAPSVRHIQAYDLRHPMALGHH